MLKYLFMYVCLGVGLLRLSVDIADGVVCKGLVDLARKVDVRVEDLVRVFIRSSVALGRHVVDSFVIRNPLRIEDKLERLEAAFKCALDMGFQLYLSFVSPLLKHFKVLGHYCLEMVEANFDDGTVYFYFSQVRGSSLYVDGIHLWLHGLNGEVEIATETIIDEGVPEEILDRLEELCKSYGDEVWGYEDFGSLEDINIYLDNGYVFFEAKAENYRCLPSVAKISNVVEKILMESGYANWESRRELRDS